MSDDHKNFGGTIEDASLAQIAAAAGRPRVDGDDPVDQLRMHCEAFINNANLSSHARMMALPKCAEMIFWIRAGAGRGSA